jgi:iron complex transport system substrate-binding protein
VSYSWPITVKDCSGRDVVIKSKPERLVSLCPSATEMLFYLGLSDEIIAVTDRCNFPPQALNKNRINGLSINTEGLMAFNSDLIVGQKGFTREELVKQADKFDLPLILLKGDNFQGIIESIALLGSATGETSVSKQIVQSMTGHMKKIKKKNSSRKNKINVFIQIWDDPLMTAGNKSFMNDIISMAGGINISGNMKKDYFQISSEWVIENNPQAIIFAHPEGKKRALDRNIWRHIEAIKDGKICEIDPDILVRPTPRLIIGIELINYWLYME